MIMPPIFTARKRSLGQCTIFRSVCQEFCPHGGCLLLRGLLPEGSAPRGVCSGGSGPEGVPGGEPPHRRATAAGGTHLTGMHSFSS